MVMKDGESVDSDWRMLSTTRGWRNHLRESAPSVVKELGATPLGAIDDMPELYTSQPVIEHFLRSGPCEGSGKLGE